MTIGTDAVEMCLGFKRTMLTSFSLKFSIVLAYLLETVWIWRICIVIISSNRYNVKVLSKY